MHGVFVVRARIEDPSLRDAFDRWYQDDHLPAAVKAFGARSAWRAWSEDDPAVHVAVYEFDDVAQARAIPGSAVLKALAADFDRAWGKKVVRERESLRVVQVV